MISENEYLVKESLYDLAPLFAAVKRKSEILDLIADNMCNYLEKYTREAYALDPIGNGSYSALCELITAYEESLEGDILKFQKAVSILHSCECCPCFIYETCSCHKKCSSRKKKNKK